MSDLYPPLGAVGAYALAEAECVPVSDAVLYLKMNGYECIGMWSDGDEYYILPGDVSPGDSVAAKALPDREGAYIPMGA